jgi:hypothetical protein
VVVCPVGWRNVHQLDMALRAVFGAGCGAVQVALSLAARLAGSRL